MGSHHIRVGAGQCPLRFSFHAVLLRRSFPSPVRVVSVLRSSMPRRRFGESVAPQQTPGAVRISVSGSHLVGSLLASDQPSSFPFPPAFGQLNEKHPSCRIIPIGRFGAHVPRSFTKRTELAIVHFPRSLATLVDIDFFVFLCETVHSLASL